MKTKKSIIIISIISILLLVFGITTVFADDEIVPAEESTNTNVEELERTHSEDTDIEVVRVNPSNPSDIITKGDLASGTTNFCINRMNHNIAEVAGKNLARVGGQIVDLSNIPSEGIVVGTGYVPKNGTVKATATQPSQGLVTDDVVYRVEKDETLGETYESAAIAYLYSRVNDAKDNAEGMLENNLQVAIWNEDYYKNTENGGVSSAYGKSDGGLLEEAKAYQKYRQDIEEFKRLNGGKAVKDTIINKTVSTNIEDREQILRTIYS